MTDESIQIHFALAQPFACRERRAFPFHPVHYRRPGSRQVRSFPRRQRLALLLVLFVNGLCLLGVGRWLYHSGRPAVAQETPGKYLQTDHFSSKFKVASATIPEVKDEPAPLKVPVVSTEPSVVAPVKIEVPPPPELPVAAVEPPRPLANVDPVDPLDSEWDPILAYSSTLAPHRGDTPMIRNWKLFELAAVMAVAVPSPILLAGGNGTKDTDTKAILEMIKEVKTQVAEVKKQVDAMDRCLGGALKNVANEVAAIKGDITPLTGLSLKMKHLNESFAGLKTELEKFKPAVPTDRVTLEDVKDVKDRLANIEKVLTRLQTEPQTRTSLSPPATAPGKIMLTNNYTDKLLFQINDQQVFVQPGQSHVLEGVPAGPFTYKVFAPQQGWSQPQNRTLEPNRTFTLSAMLP
jgi:hypothetical protein